MEEHKRMVKYIYGMSAVLRELAREIRADGAFSKEKQELLSKIGCDLLFKAKTYDFLSEDTANHPHSRTHETKG